MRSFVRTLPAIGAAALIGILGLGHSSSRVTSMFIET
jgi:hypothetical protein